MELLERYLLQVERYLPHKDRKDTIDELRSLLLDQFDSRVEEGLEEYDLIYIIIKEFGYPKDVALKYRSTQPLVSRELEPLMFLIIKIMSVILPVVLLLVNLIEFYNSGETVTVMSMLLESAYTIPDILTTYITALLVVFVTFVVLERYATLPIVVEEKEFDPNSLLPLPKKVYKVSLFETVFNILGDVLILYLINMRQGLITIYFENIAQPLLNTNFEAILLLINISIFLGLAIHIIHLVKRRKNFTTATMELFHRVYAVVIFIILSTTSVFNVIVIEGYNLTTVTSIFKTLMIIGAVGTAVGAFATYLRVIIAKSK